MSIIRGKIFHPKLEDTVGPIIHYVGCEPHEWPKDKDCEILTLREALLRAGLEEYLEPDGQ